MISLIKKAISGTFAIIAGDDIEHVSKYQQ
jgi:hypothetical protein